MQGDNGSSNRNGSIYFSSPGNTIWGVPGTPDYIPKGVPEEYHFNGSNFLFVDGHVKWMRPPQTWTAAQNVRVQSLNAAYYNCRGGRRGHGPVDLWNPEVGSVIYP